MKDQLHHCSRKHHRQHAGTNMLSSPQVIKHELLYNQNPPSLRGFLSLNIASG